jgi:hypothetical protein
VEGAGTINAFDPVTGAFLGQLQHPDGTPIAIPGLWDLAFGAGSKNNGKTNQLFFSGGPNVLNPAGNGLFGMIHVPGDADRVQIAAPPTAFAGMPFDVTITALDPYGNIATGYTGTVSLAGSDPQAALPADYTFTAADSGMHTFARVTLLTAGAQTLTAQDTAEGPLAGSATVAVASAPADHFLITAPPAIMSGTPFDLTITALDPYGNVDPNYTGTATWASSDTDSAVILPADYTFQSTDSGTYTFPAGATLITPGDQTLTAADTGNGIIGSATVTVIPGPHPPPGGGTRGPRIPSLNADIIPAQVVEAVPKLASVDRLFSSVRQEKAGLLLARRKHDGAADDLFGVLGAVVV